MSEAAAAQWIARLDLQEISKRFGTNQALDRASLSVRAGEIHALLGENGAGKSTLMHIAAGLIQPDGGVIRVDGSEIRFDTASTARAAGIGMVHQHFTSVSSFTVADNIALTAGWPETGAAAVERAGALIADLGLPLDPRARASQLSVQLRQRLEIVKALASHGTVLLLDEPTAALAPREADELFRALAQFRQRGNAIVLITHRIADAMEVADRISVLRHGRIQLSGESVKVLDATKLARAMIGGEIATVSVARNRQAGDVVFSANALALPGFAVPVTFELRRGEIAGMVGLEDSGYRTLLRAVAAGSKSPAIRVTGQVALVPEDRTQDALIGEMSLAENVYLQPVAGANIHFDADKLRHRTEQIIDRFHVRGGDADTPAVSLSGGNQQKLVIGRALSSGSVVLVAEHPFRGLDVQAAREVRDAIVAAADSGVAVLIYSPDIDEVLALADRLLVVRAGTARELPGSALRADVGDAMLGISPFD